MVSISIKLLYSCAMIRIMSLCTAPHVSTCIHMCHAYFHLQISTGACIHVSHPLLPCISNVPHPLLPCISNVPHPLLPCISNVPHPLPLDVSICATPTTSGMKWTHPHILLELHSIIISTSLLSSCHSLILFTN